MYSSREFMLKNEINILSSFLGDSVIDSIVNGRKYDQCKDFRVSEVWVKADVCAFLAHPCVA